MKQLYLSQIKQISAADASAAQLAELADQSLELLIVSSSGEIEIMATAEARAVVRAALPHPAAPVVFVSVGCSGLYASVLEFIQSGAQKARVLLLESPAEFVQSTLDHAGMGADGDGFVAQDVSFCFTLSYQATPLAWHVQYCAIFARPASISGTARLASKVLSQMANLLQEQPDARLVTFENCSEWSRRLAQMMNALCPQYALPPVAEWLPTVENKQHHYMTVRPLLDLAALEPLARQQPIILSCLGAGGRFGVILLSTCEHLRSTHFALPEAQPFTLEVPELVPDLKSAQEAEPRIVLYAQREYFGRDNFYFKWRLHREHWQPA